VYAGVNECSWRLDGVRSGRAISDASLGVQSIDDVDVALLAYDVHFTDTSSSGLALTVAAMATETF
jgi:hypothetical protein